MIAARRNPNQSITAVAAATIMIFWICGGGWGADDNGAGEFRLNKNFFSRFGRDFGAVVSSPSHWNKRDWLTFTAVSGFGLLLFSLDEDINDWVQGRRSPSSQDFSSVIEKLGNGGVLLAMMGALYAAGEISRRDGWRKTALLSVESLATASVIVWALKAATGRARPDSGESSHSFHPFTLDSAHHSFPSGHAASAFAVATTIAEQSDSVVIDVLSYSLAAIVPLSRVHDQKHWASDVFMGAALGYFVAKKISGLNRPGARKTLNLGFQFSRDRQALTLAVEF
jgi:membrane-associated phospholipid phosphatase